MIQNPKESLKSYFYKLIYSNHKVLCHFANHAIMLYPPKALWQLGVFFS